MKKNNAEKNTGGNAAALVIVYRCLLIAAILLAFFIATVTVYTFISRSLAKGEPVYTIPEPERPPQPLPEPPEPDGGAVFSGIGRIRTASADGNTIIVSIAFPYNRDDIPFAEELTARITEFRNISFAFLSGQTAEALRTMGEGAIKAALLEQYNAVLKLGSITELYFNDFMIVD
jgi:flagellar basal body-associated protein FliL